MGPFYLKISKGCNFLIFEARRIFFAENVYLHVNFILEISKNKFQRLQLYLAAASRLSRRENGGRSL